MAKLNAEIGEVDLKRMIQQYFSAKLGIDLKLEDIKIEVKSKQNFRSEWEVAAFRAIYEGTID